MGAPGRFRYTGPTRRWYPDAILLLLLVPLFRVVSARAGIRNTQMRTNIRKHLPNARKPHVPVT
jgi:hypothetical protein